MKNVAVAGVGMTDVGVFPNAHPFDLGLQTILEALADSRLDKDEIGAIFCTKTGYMVDNYMFVHQRMAEYLQIPTKSIGEVDCGGASSLVALHHVASEIALGRIEAGLVFASHWEYSTKHMIEHFAEEQHILRLANGLYGSYDSRLGVVSPIAYYAMCQQRYMQECGVTPEQVALLPVVLRENAALNPHAMYKEPLTVDEVLNSPVLSPPIRLLESCPLAHGAAAVVLASEDRARQVSDNPVVITGFGEAHDDAHFIPASAEMSRFPAVRRSAEEAYSAAGTGPEDIDVAEVYGAFAGPELMCYEELGFFERGEAPTALEAGRTRAGGDLVINTSGGRLSLGHPAFATPLFEVFEITTQLRGEAGSRQVPDAKRGLVQAEHGMINGSVVLVMEVD
jgi:acetyl-CoA C-acetyltransferase